MAGRVVLVAGVAALGAWVVDAAVDTTCIYALSQDVVPGTDLTADGILAVVETHPSTDAYVKTGHLPDDAILTRSMRKEELLVVAAANNGREQELRPAVLTVVPNLSASTKAGGYVDLRIVSKEGVAGRPAAQAPTVGQAG